MLSKKTAIVLGGTVPHCELINQLKERDYYTILVDYLPDSPGKHYADLHIQESTLDKEAVMRIAEEYNADLVISGCVDQANITACYVMEKLGKYVPYSYDKALEVTNKGSMKSKMIEMGIPTSRYIYIDHDKEDVRIDLNYPVMVKPADSNSANGVKRAYNADEMKLYVSNAVRISRNGRAIVEEYVEGREISAYCYIKDNKAKLLMTAERISSYDGDDKVIKCFASIAPARISEKAKENAEKIATQIANAFELNNTPLFFQGIVNEDSISVIEFAPRVGGGSCFKTIKANTGFDVIDATIKSWLNIPVSFDNWSDTSKMYVVNTVYAKDGVFSRLEGYESLEKDGTIENLLQIRVPGETIDNSRASSSRICFFIVSAGDEAELIKKVETVYSNLKVIDESGKNIIRKDLNIVSVLKK